jgi:hypothetical protein
MTDSNKFASSLYRTRENYSHSCSINDAPKSPVRHQSTLQPIVGVQKSRKAAVLATLPALTTSCSIKCAINKDNKNAIQAEPNWSWESGEYLINWVGLKTLKIVYTSHVLGAPLQDALALTLYSCKLFFRESCSMHGITNLTYAWLLDPISPSPFRCLSRAGKVLPWAETRGTR